MSPNSLHLWPTARIGLLAALLVGAIASSVAPAQAGYYYRHHRRSSSAVWASRARRQSMINAANGQLYAANQALAAAEMSGANAQARLGTATAKLQVAASELSEARKSGWDLEVHQRQIEKEILGDQTADSEYAKAQAEVESQKRELAKLEASLLADEKIQAQLSRLKGDDLTTARAAAFRDIIEYKLAKADLDTAVGKLDHIRRELFRADPDWKQNVAALSTAHSDQRTAETHVTTGGMSRLRPLQDFRSAASVASSARAAIAEAQYVLRSLGAAPKYTPPSASSKSSSPK